MILVGEYGVIEKSCRPTEIAFIERGFREFDDTVETTHRRHVTRPDRFGRVRPQPRRVAVEPAHVALVHGLDIVADRAVVAVRVPGPLQRRRHRERLGDLDAGVALVELTQRLVVQVGVQIPLQRKEFHDLFLAPRRPVMRGEHHVGPVGERVDRLGEVPGPAVRIAHQRPAQRQQVVQVVRGVLGHAQRTEPRKVEVHLGRRLGSRGHLELDLDTVDGVLLAGLADVEGRHDDRHLARRRGLPQTAAHLALRTPVQRGAVHVAGATRHRGTGVDVLLHRMLGEALRGDHDDPAGVDILLRGDPEDAPEVVDVAVGVNDSAHGTITPVLPVQRQRRGGDLGGHQRVDHDDAGVALDDRHVRQVEAADLVDAGHHLVKSLLGHQGRLPPQARVHAGRRVAGQERVDVVVPHHASIGGGDDTGFLLGDEPTVGIGEIPGVAERECVQVFAVGSLDRRRGRLVLHVCQDSHARPVRGG